VMMHGTAVLVFPFVVEFIAKIRRDLCDVW